MALTKNMTSDEMVRFLNNELLPQVRQEIGNLIRPKKKQGGYFVTVRQIMCMVDFLGATFSGYSRKERMVDKKRQKISTSEKAIRFIIKFFKPEDTYQEGIVRNLYNMYRHGLVHLYQPKILKWKSNGRLLWFFYKGNRHVNKIKINTDKGILMFKNVDHLHILQSGLDKNSYYLAVCVESLYEDFEKAVQLYIEKLSKTKTLQTKWRTTVNSICMPY